MEQCPKSTVYSRQRLRHIERWLEVVAIAKPEPELEPEYAGLKLGSAADGALDLTLSIAVDSGYGSRPKSENNGVGLGSEGSDRCDSSELSSISKSVADSMLHVSF